MKKSKNRFALSILSFLLVLTLLTGATAAWFTEMKTAHVDVTSGILDVKLSEGESGEKIALHFANLLPLSQEQLADTFQMDENGVITNKGQGDFNGASRYFYQIHVKNEGTIPMQVALAVREQGETSALPYGHKIPNLVDNGAGGMMIDPDESEIACRNDLRELLQIQLYRAVKDSGKDVLRPVLAEGQDDTAASLWKDAAPEDYTLPETLGAGEQESYILAAWLPNTVGNEGQGKHFHASLLVSAGQADEGASMPKLPDGSSVSASDADTAQESVPIP